MEKFYVYEWYNTKTNEIFYVGKGKGQRYRNKTDRNKLFLKYISQNEVESRIVKFFTKEEDAFSYEKELTNQYKEKGLCKCNLINGGYGGYSKVWTEEMREYMSTYNPMKSDIQKKRMSVNNPMKNKEIAKKVGATKKRPVIIDGVEFPGTIDAARFFEVWENTILNWCKRGYNTEGKPCRYKDEKQKEYKKRITSSREVLVDDYLVFSSLKEAAKYFGVTDTSPLCKAIKNNKKYHGHKVEYVNQQPS